MLSLLFSFQKLAVTFFFLLKCIDILGVTVLFIDATIECYSVWQHIMLGYVVTSIIPFGLYISAAPYFLTSGHMTLISFYFGCHFPLPSLFYITYLRMRNFKPINHQHWSNEASAVSILLQGPFLFNVSVGR